MGNSHNFSKNISPNQYICPFFQYNNSHPGCKCKDGFSGPHCELSPNAPETPNTNLGIYAPDARATANSGRSGFQKFLLSFFVLSVILSISYLATFLWKRRPRRRNIIAENIRWATEYQDRSPDINLAPVDGTPRLAIRIIRPMFTPRVRIRSRRI